MKKRTAIRLLRTQLQKINNDDIKRDEWLISTSAVLLRVFPLSASKKIEQLEQIQNNPDYFEDLPAQKIIDNRKEKARRYLNNYIEEIEVMGTESTGSKLELFFGSFRFWMILSSICILSFIAGTTSSGSNEPGPGIYEQTRLELFKDMERRLDLQKSTIDSLSYELEKLRLKG
jgi:hypothetical protein